MSGRIGGRDTGVRLLGDDAHFMAQQRVSTDPGAGGGAGAKISHPLVPTTGKKPEYALAVEWLEAGHK